MSGLLKVLNCQSLLNLIKDFSGILAEYPLYFITKKAPRVWGWQWWNHTWVCPKDRKEHIMIKLDINAQHFNPLTQSSCSFALTGFPAIQCYTDEYKNFWPVNTHNSQSTKKLKTWNECNIHEKPSTATDLWTIRPLSISIAYIMEDTHPVNICFPVQRAIFASYDFNYLLIRWYSQNLFTMTMNSAKDYSQLREHISELCLNRTYDLSNVSQDDVSWIRPQFFSELNHRFNWLKYHFKALSWHDWNQCESPWNGVEKFLECKLFSTLERFLKDFSVHFNYCQDVLRWNDKIKNLDHVQLIYFHLIKNNFLFENVCMNFSYCNPEIFEFFIGKIRCGLFSYFEMALRVPWTKLFLSNESKERKLLFKAWNYFTSKEKNLFFSKSHFDIITNLKVLGKNIYSHQQFLKLDENCDESIYSFFHKLLEKDLWLELVYSDDPIKNEMLLQFQTCCKEKKERKATLYLHLFFFTSFS